MMRTVVGFCLLILLLAGGILSGKHQTQHHEQIAHLLEQASVQAGAGQLADARETAAEARRIWEGGWSMAAVFTDHNPLEQVDVGFIRLKIYGEAGDALAFAVVCGELSGQVQALGDAHGSNWWNFL